MFGLFKKKKPQPEDLANEAEKIDSDLNESQSQLQEDQQAHSHEEQQDQQVEPLNAEKVPDEFVDRAPVDTLETEEEITSQDENKTQQEAAVNSESEIQVSEPVDSVVSQDLVETVIDEIAEQSPIVEAANNELIESNITAPIENSEDVPSSPTIDSSIETPVANTEVKPEKAGLFGRLRQGLSKTGNAITDGMDTLFIGKKEIDDDVLEELENRLLMADLGMDATLRIINNLTQKVEYYELFDSKALLKAMHQEMTTILQPVAKPLVIDENNKPTVILMVGINGAGKTTTIGKLAKKYQNQGKSVMLAAGDTFRAAAVEQLQVWGERNDIPVVAQGTGADTASVIYDAMESAKARNVDILLADTAGRLHTQTNLMEELKKVKRVMQKIDETAPHEIMLIVDASIGQNALAQAKEFNKALGLTGISVTKLDGTAKGGILFAIAEQTGIPVRFIGVGESIDDLQEFDAYEFTGALLAE